MSLYMTEKKNALYGWCFILKIYLLSLYSEIFPFPPFKKEKQYFKKKKKKKKLKYSFIVLVLKTDFVLTINDVLV